MSYKPSFALLTLGALVLPAAAAQAQTTIISFSFAGSSGTPAFVDPALAAGFVPAFNFNSDNGGTSGSVTNSPDGLTDSNGNVSGTTLTYTAPSDGNNGLDTADANYDNDGNQQLLNGFIQSGAVTSPSGVTTPGSASVTVSSIPFASYSLYVYAYNGASSLGTFMVTPGGGVPGTPQTALLQSSFDPNNPFTLATATSAGDYLLFSGLTASSFTLAANSAVPSASGTPAIPIDGFQIVQTPAASAAPEPSQWASLGLTAFGVLGLICRARRKQAA